MVCTSFKHLLELKDFPKGLKVLVIDKDASSSSELKSKLEEMHYIVSTFHHEDEALSAILDKFEDFHVAIVDISNIDNNGDFKFLRMTKGLPTIIVADSQCVTTTMKCISLGAIEVLNKPVCDDKLRNIWQHVVRKAYKTEESGLPESATQVITNSTIPTINKDEMIEEIQCLLDDFYDYDKYSAPSTPQLKQVRTQDDDDVGFNVRTNWSIEKDSAAVAEHYEESKSVETTFRNRASVKHDSVINDSAGGHRINELETSGPCGHKTKRKKMKVDWTWELEKKFIQAVEQLGIDKAIPSRILELMKVDGLTRHNVASHLQKYRMQRRHSLPKEKRIFLRPKDTMQNSYYNQHKSIINYASASNHGYPPWTQLGSHTAGVQPWCGHSFSPYQTWPWKSYTPPADAWGCPVMPSLHSSYSYYPYNDIVTNGGETALNLIDDRLEDEVIDKMIKEAMEKPTWVPLPIGLKPPSTESVLVELSKKGISNIPPRLRQTRHTQNIN